MSHQTRQVDQLHLVQALQSDRSERYSAPQSKDVWAIIKITKLSTASGDGLYRGQRQRFDRDNKIVDHAVTEEVIVGSPMCVPLAVGDVVFCRLDNTKADGSPVYNAWIQNPGIPVNPKILHATAFDLETIDTATEVDWDYSEWAKHDVTTYPKYYTDKGVEYDGYEVFEIARGPIYKQYGDKKIYVIYCRALYTPDGRRVKRWDYKRYEIATKECQG